MAFNWRKFPWTNLHDLNLDWIIQTVKTLEENLADAVSTFQEMINRAILNTLAGEGEFNVIKTGNVLINGKNVEMRAGEVAEGGNSIKLSENGDVRISGNSVQLTGGTVVSDGAEQLTLHNPNSNTSVTASYNNGVLSLWNNQDLSAGVAVYPINTPADGGGDNSSFAANVGYVKDAVAAVDGKLDTEISNRASGDAALRSTINDLIMPLLNAQRVHDFHVAGTAKVGGALESVAFVDGYPKSDLDNLLAQGKRVRLVVIINNETRYFERCYTNGGYVAFSGMYIDDNEVTAAQVIRYSGTNFVPLETLHML